MPMSMTSNEIWRKEQPVCVSRALPSTLQSLPWAIPSFSFPLPVFAKASFESSSMLLPMLHSCCWSVQSSADYPILVVAFKPSQYKRKNHIIFCLKRLWLRKTTSWTKKGSKTLHCTRLSNSSDGHWRPMRPMGWQPGPEKTVSSTGGAAETSVLMTSSPCFKVFPIVAEIR